MNMCNKFILLRYKIIPKASWLGHPFFFLFSLGLRKGRREEGEGLVKHFRMNKLIYVLKEVKPPTITRSLRANRHQMNAYIKYCDIAIFIYLRKKQQAIRAASSSYLCIETCWWFSFGSNERFERNTLFNICSSSMFTWCACDMNDSKR